MTSADLIQAMVESFRIYGKEESDTRKSESKVISSATMFKFIVTFHKAKDCHQHEKIKCKHCGKFGHKKKICWKLDVNSSKRPKWFDDTTALRIDDKEITL